MRIALVGGLRRRESELTQLAQEAGHQLEWHTGYVGGRGAEGLKATVERSDVVVIITQINSHGSMYLVKRLAQRLGRRAVLLRKCGPAKFRTLLEELATSRAA